MATGALIGYGTLFAISTDGVSYTTLAEVRSLNPPSDNIEIIDATNMDSPGRRREYVSGFIDGGEMTLELNFIPGNSTDQTIRARVDAGTAFYCRITWTTGVVWTFLGIPRSYEVNAPTDDIMTATLVVKMTASLTIT
jgi:predicted secreted protein